MSSLADLCCASLRLALRTLGSVEGSNSSLPPLTDCSYAPSPLMPLAGHPTSRQQLCLFSLLFSQVFSCLLLCQSYQYSWLLLLLLIHSWHGVSVSSRCSSAPYSGAGFPLSSELASGEAIIAAQNHLLRWAVIQID